MKTFILLAASFFLVLDPTSQSALAQGASKQKPYKDAEHTEKKNQQQNQKSKSNNGKGNDNYDASPHKEVHDNRDGEKKGNPPQSNKNGSKSNSRDEQYKPNPSNTKKATPAQQPKHR